MRLRTLLVLVVLGGGCDDSVPIECTGDACRCLADTSSCSHTCTAGQPCSLSCEDAVCDWDCNGAASCAVNATSTASATIDCAGGPCTVSCNER